MMLFASFTQTRAIARALVPCPSANPPPLVISDVAPRAIPQSAPTVLTIYGSGFANSTVVDMLGVGVLPTEYIGPTLLRATAPSSLTPARYGIAVRDELAGACSNVFEAVTVNPPPADPATPSAPPTVTPGRPVLVLRSFSVTPTRVKAGQEFEVEIVLYNTGSRAAENTLVTALGGAFVPLGNTGTLVGQMHINASVTIRQRFRAPEAVASGLAEAKFLLSANDFSGENYTASIGVPVEVEGAATPMPGRPNLVIEQVTNTPGDVGAGGTFTMTFRIANRGTRAAVNVLVTVKTGELATPADGSNSTSVRGLGVGQSVEVWQPLTINARAEAGRKSADVTIDYTDNTGTSYSTQQVVGFDVASASTGQRPQLVLERYDSVPDLVYAGEPFTLSMLLRNVGSGPAMRVSTAAGGEGGANLKPFAPVGTGNVQYVKDVNANAVIEINQQLMADVAADPGTFNLPVALAYEDLRGARITETQMLSLQVRRRPLMRIALSRPGEPVIATQPATVAIDVVNIGRKAINTNVVEVESDAFDVSSVQPAYIGNLAEGTSAGIEVQATAKTAGPATMTVRVNYYDEFNVARVVTGVLTLNAAEGPPVPEPGRGAPGAETPERAQEPWFVRLVKGLFGLGS